MSWKTTITRQTGNMVWVKAIELDITDKPTGIETDAVTHDINDGDVEYLVSRLKEKIDELGAPTADEIYETKLGVIDDALATALIPQAG